MNNYQIEDLHSQMSQFFSPEPNRKLIENFKCKKGPIPSYIHEAIAPDESAHLEWVRVGDKTRFTEPTWSSSSQWVETRCVGEENSGSVNTKELGEAIGWCEEHGSLTVLRFSSVWTEMAPTANDLAVKKKIEDKRSQLSGLSYPNRTGSLCSCMSTVRAVTNTGMPCQHIVSIMPFLEILGKLNKFSYFSLVLKKLILDDICI